MLVLSLGPRDEFYVVESKVFRCFSVLLRIICYKAICCVLDYIAAFWFEDELFRDEVFLSIILESRSYRSCGLNTVYLKVSPNSSLLFT